MCSTVEVNMNSLNKKLVLYIEDDEDDQALCNMALEDSQLEVDLQFLNDGQSAMDYFEKISQDDSRDSWPKLLLLDLSMPAINGWDSLAAFRSYEALRSIPVVIFTTSNSPRDRMRAYKEGANAYMVKPAGLQDLTECLEVTFTYWLNIVTAEGM